MALDSVVCMWCRMCCVPLAGSPLDFIQCFHGQFYWVNDVRASAVDRSHSHVQANLQPIIQRVNGNRSVDDESVCRTVCFRPMHVRYISLGGEPCTKAATL